MLSERRQGLRQSCASQPYTAKSHDASGIASERRGAGFGGSWCRRGSTRCNRPSGRWRTSLCQRRRRRATPRTCRAAAPRCRCQEGLPKAPSRRRSLLRHPRKPHVERPTENPQSVSAASAHRDLRPPGGRAPVRLGFVQRGERRRRCCHVDGAHRRVDRHGETGRDVAGHDAPRIGPWFCCLTSLVWAAGPLWRHVQSCPPGSPRSPCRRGRGSSRRCPRRR